MSQTRQLAAIMFTDIVGYTALMGKDEQKAFELLDKNRQIQKPIIEQYNGKWIKELGDGVMASFNTVSDAVNAAIKIQQTCSTSKEFQLRIGIHLGEVVFENDDVFGDGVNIASRIQAVANPGSIYISEAVHNSISNKKEFQTKFVKGEKLKNVKELVKIYQVIAEGVVAGHSAPIAEKIKKNRTIGFISLIAIILLAAIYFYTNSKKAGEPNEKSIAILPFKIIGDYKDNISEGLVEDILVRLSKIKELKVISNKSSVRYTDPKKSLKEIGEEIGVTSLVMGSIEQFENRIIVRAQLIDCKTQNTVWAEKYDSAIVKIFDLQTEVALQIANALQAKLTPDEKKRLSKRYTDNVEAYKFYRKGRSFWDKRSKENFDSAEANYKLAIQLDPDYALAYVGLADCYTINEQGLSQLDAIPIARNYVNRALSLDSTLSEALTTLGFIYGVFDYDIEKGIATIEKAIMLDPNYPTAHLYYGNYWIQAGGRPDLGVYENKKALELDPLSSNINYVLGRNYYFANKLDSAYMQLKKTLILYPQNNLAKATLAHVLLAKKNFSEAFELIRQLPKTGPANLLEYQGAFLSYACAVSGDTTRAKIELEKTLNENPDQVSYYLAHVYTILKDYGKALGHLDKAYKLRELSMVFLKVDPVLAPLRNEPRFIALLKNMNLD